MKATRVSGVLNSWPKACKASFIFLKSCPKYMPKFFCHLIRTLEFISKRCFQPASRKHVKRRRSSSNYPKCGVILVDNFEGKFLTSQNYNNPPGNYMLPKQRNYINKTNCELSVLYARVIKFLLSKLCPLP